jgi:hypothetical protein
MLSDRLRSLKMPLWIDNVESLKAAALGGLSADEFDEVKQGLNAAVSKQQRGRILNWLTLGLVADENQMLDEIKRKGLFRASKYDFNPVCPASTAIALLQAVPKLGLSESTAEYLRSVGSLLSFATAVREKQITLAKQLRSDPYTSLKSLLVALDMLFLKREIGQPQCSTATHAFELEELAEGFSYLLYLYDKVERLKDASLIMVDVSGIKAGKYDAMLSAASLIRIYQQCEILLDTLGYKCASDSSGQAVIVSPPEPTIEKSIRWGYVQQAHHTASERSAAETNSQEQQGASHRFVARELYKCFGQKHITIATDLGTRFVFGLPMIKDLAEYLSSIDVYREEVVLVGGAETDYFIPFKELAQLKIAESLTVGDIFKIHRWINIYRWYVVEHLLKHGGIESDISLRSMAPFFTREKIVEFLGIALPEKSKAEEALKCLSWKRDNQKVFDVQYQPIIAGEHYYALPMNVFGSSNAVRNALQLSRKRPGEQFAEEPIGKALAARFASQGIWAKHSINYRFNGLNGEIDAMAMIGESLFVFECKNALVPCNIFELRTSYEHIVRARKQLDTIVSLFGLPGFRERLCQPHGWLGENPKNLITCIVLGNKMFSGYRNGPHPVRSFSEIAGFVWPGKVGFGDIIIASRPEGLLDEKSLRNYLESDSFHTNIFRCMRRIRRDYSLGSKTLSLDSYALDMRALARCLDIPWKSEN